MKTWLKFLIIVICILIFAALASFIYFKTQFISEAKVKELVAKDMNVKEDEIHFDKIELEFDKKIYDVNLFYDNSEYEYKLNAKDGVIIYTNYSDKATNDTKDSGEVVGVEAEETQTQSTTGKVKTIDEVKAIVLNKEKLTAEQVTFSKITQEMKNGINVYEVEFTYNGYEYEYTINAETGVIIGYSKTPVPAANTTTQETHQ